MAAYCCGVNEIVGSDLNQGERIVQEVEPGDTLAF